jgi:hypothetical protein
MKRRTFLEALAASAGTLVGGSTAAHGFGLFNIAAPDALRVKRVLTVFKCHFDAGFVDTQAAVVKRYFEDYFPKAITTAASLSQEGSPKYVWTTGSWLLYEYLEQVDHDQRKRMEEAIHSGYIAWHALPFSWQTEMMDPSMISGAIALSQALDRRFGCKTTGAKMTDVPGHTRGIVQPLASAGVTFLDIGVNDASTPAILPGLFQWKDATGASIAVMYHSGYGGIEVVPDSDAAFAIVVKGDNSGPHTPEEISQTFATLKSRFPNAEIVPTNLTVVANEVARHTYALPVVTQEVGDTWIHGIASDPLKVARYREVSRLRQRWISEGRFAVGDPTDIGLLRHLLLEVEHTWGTDTKTWLDFDNYLPQDLRAMLDTRNYKVVEFSWNEKRQDLFSGIDTLPPVLKAEALAAIDLLNAKPPRPLAQSHPAEKDLNTTHFIVQFDQETGAIHKLHHKKTGRDWAAHDHPLALFSYQTLSQDDYAAFFRNYVISNEDWAKKDFGKPNIERFGAESRIWQPRLLRLETSEDEASHRLLAYLKIDDDASIASGRAAFPKRIIAEYVFPKAEPSIEVNVYWAAKAPTRLPEAIWMTFNPIAPDPMGWTMQKTGQRVSPYDVVDSGNRHTHAVSDGVFYEDNNGSLSVHSIDAPLVALGKRAPLGFSRSQPDLREGIHYNLFNNAWGTNYIMWFGEDMSFRFVIRL